MFRAIAAVLPTVSGVIPLCGSVRKDYKGTFNPAACPIHSSADNCFGAQGDRCAKGGPGGVGDDCPSGWQAMSVGSLAHDACCRCTTNGAFCSGEKMDWWSWSKPCHLEWVKAFRNWWDQRYWCVKQDQIRHQPNMKRLDDHRLNRKYTMADDYVGQNVVCTNEVPRFAATRKMIWSYSLFGTDTNDPKDPSKARREMFCAPPGTHLDCIGCGTSRIGGRQKGDSDFCCSRRFRTIQSNWWTTWGTCA